jgi:Tfp pilus assembly protein PilO
MDQKKFSLKLDSSKIKILVSALALLSAGALAAFLVPKILDLIEEKEDIRRESKDLQKKLSMLLNYESQLEEIEAGRKELEEALPVSIDPPDFMGRISKVADESGVAVDSFRFMPGSDLSALLKFSFSGKAPYDNVIVFLKNLENFAGILDLSSVNISKSDTGGSAVGEVVPGSLGVSLTVEASYLPKSTSEESPALPPESFNFSNPELQGALSIAGKLVQWESEVYTDTVGRDNPFAN